MNKIFFEYDFSRFHQIQSIAPFILCPSSCRIKCLPRWRACSGAPLSRCSPRQLSSIWTLSRPDTGRSWPTPATSTTSCTRQGNVAVAAGLWSRCGGCSLNALFFCLCACHTHILTQCLPFYNCAGGLSSQGGCGRDGGERTKSHGVYALTQSPLSIRGASKCALRPAPAPGALLCRQRKKNQPVCVQRQKGLGYYE